jgi:hypothetical protein
MQNNPIMIEWDESSGPLPPAYFYHTNLKIVAKDDKIFIELDDEGKIKAGVPERSVHIKDELNQAQFKEMIEKLNINNLTDRLLSEETKRLIGVSFNSLKITNSDNTQILFEYTLADLKKPENTDFANIISGLKQFVGTFK